jgi:hypothetical protein
MSNGGSMTFEELAQQRRNTELISKFLKEQLAKYLEILRPIVSPERVLGKHAGGRLEVPGADRTLSELQQKIRDFSKQPFDLPTELDPHWLTLVGNRLELYPWEYTYEATSPRETKTITMTSPGKWIVAYASSYTATQMKQVLVGKDQRRAEYVRQFVVNALVLQSVLGKTPGLDMLLNDLRFKLATEQAPDFRHLPLVTLTSCLPSFRPVDDLIIAATSMSGIPAFIEFIDLDAVRNLQDPLKLRIEELLK